MFSFFNFDYSNDIFDKCPPTLNLVKHTENRETFVGEEALNISQLLRLSSNSFPDMLKNFDKS